MNILYLAHRIPYPPNKGDKIRSFHEIKYLSTHHDIYLACLADDPADLSYAKELGSFCKTVDIVSINPQKQKVKSLFVLPTEKPLSVAYFYSKKLQQIIDHRLSAMSYDAIICFSSSMAEYVFRTKNVLTCERVNVSTLKRSTATLVQNVSNNSGNSNDSNDSNNSNASSNSNTRLIMDFVDVDSDKWQQYARYARWPFSWIYKLESRRLAAYEKRVADSFHRSIFVSKKEAELFRSRNPGVGTVLTMPNGVDFIYFKANASSNSNNSNDPNNSNNSGNSNDSSNSNISNVKPPVLLFTGAMDYYANIDGVVWFSKEIFPHLLKQFPSLTFYIVGRNPTPEVKALVNSHIKVTGYVEDIRPFYEMATIYVAPLRIARGIQNKILEAMAMARPVIATSKAYEGIEAIPGQDLLIADSGTEFIEKITTLLRDERRQTFLGVSARQRVESNYSWEHSLQMFEKILV